MRASITPLLIGAAIASSTVILALGPLDPPPGPVSPTAPSLADIKADLEQIILSQGGSGGISGPFESFRRPVVGDFQNDLDGELIAEGRVYVHSITVTYGIVVLFDGPGGTIASDNSRVLSGDWIARSLHDYKITYVPTSAVSVQYTTVTTPVEQIVNNGLYAAWHAGGAGGSVVITYKRLPPLTTDE